MTKFDFTDSYSMCQTIISTGHYNDSDYNNDNKDNNNYYSNDYTVCVVGDRVVQYNVVRVVGVFVVHSGHVRLPVLG